MEKNKIDFMTKLLTFANADLKKMTPKKCVKMVLDMDNSGGDVLGILRPKNYSGGVIARRNNLKEKKGKIPILVDGELKQKETIWLVDRELKKADVIILQDSFLGIFRKLLKGDSEDLSTLNITVRGAMPEQEVRELRLKAGVDPEEGDGGHWSLAVTTGQPAGYNPILWRTLVKLGWALDGLPADRIKACPECGKYFLQRTTRPKIFCSHNCAVKAIDKRRTGTEKRNLYQVNRLRKAKGLPPVKTRKKCARTVPAVPIFP